jgi:hypothetical protein
MADRDTLADRGRALEEDYFRKRDRELLEKMRGNAESARVQAELERATGMHDPAVLQELQALGFTPETVALLPIVPLVEVAWAEGGVTGAERAAIEDVARQRGISEGSAAWHHLAGWLTARPSQAVFAGAGRLIAAMLDAGAVPTRDLRGEDLVQYCERIAAASGGIFGLTLRSVSPEERVILSRVAAQLTGRRG